MKKHLVNCWFVACILVLVAACGKEKSLEGGTVNQYYIKCKIGSVDKTFNVSAAASKADMGDGSFTYSIFGKASSTASDYESIGLALRIYVPFVTGTYKETDPTTDYLVAGIYNPNTTDATKIYASLGDANNPFQVTFTTIDSTTLAGTFKGSLILNNGASNPDSAVITNGQFKVKLK